MSDFANRSGISWNSHLRIKSPLNLGFSYFSFENRELDVRFYRLSLGVFRKARLGIEGLLSLVLPCFSIENELVWGLGEIPVKLHQE